MPISPKTHAQHSFSAAVFQDTVLGEQQAATRAAMGKVGASPKNERF
jgi:hypothetical protein